MHYPSASSQVQMARQLAEPGEPGKIDNRKQEPWKLPLPRFIEQLYFECFGKSLPTTFVCLEERCRVEGPQSEARRAARQHITEGMAYEHGPRPQ